MFVYGLTFVTTFAHTNMHNLCTWKTHRARFPLVGMHPYGYPAYSQQGGRWAFSQWELCQFSFHYSTWRLNPHYHNKLYFYRHVQTEAAFQGIRLNFTWPPVFLGNTSLPQLPPRLLPTFFLHMEHAACCISYLSWYCILLFQNSID